MTTITTINSLPKEVLSLTLSHIDISSRKKASLVCRFWRESWQDSVQRLHLRGEGLDKLEELDGKYPNLPGYYFKGVKRLFLDRINISQIEKIAKRVQLHTVAHLVFAFLEFSPNAETKKDEEQRLAIFFEKFSIQPRFPENPSSHLRWVDLSTTPIQGFCLEKLPDTVRLLNLAQCQKLTKFSGIAFNFRNLSSLDVSYCMALPFLLVGHPIYKDETEEKSLKFIRKDGRKSNSLDVFDKMVSEYSFSDLELLLNDPIKLTEALDKGLNPDAANGANETLLYHAVKMRALDAVKILLQRGANPDRYSTTRPETALRAAIALKDPKAATLEEIECVKLLLAYGANPGEFDSYMQTALDIPIARWPTDSFKKLIDSGIDLNLHDEHGNTLLHRAVQSRDFEKAALLLEKGADPLAANFYGKTPFSALLGYSLNRWSEEVMAEKIKQFENTPISQTFAELLTFEMNAKKSL